MYRYDMKPIYFNGTTYTNAFDWCRTLLVEMRMHDIDVECIELYPIHKQLDTESILNEMSIDDLKNIVRDILNYYK